MNFNLAVLLHTVNDVKVTNVMKKTIRDDNTSGNTNWTYCFLFEVILHHVQKHNIVITLPGGVYMWRCYQWCYC